MGDDGGWTVERELVAGAAVAAADTVIEVALPFASLGAVDSGDVFQVRGIISRAGSDIQIVPGSGPAKLVIPDLGLTTTVLEVVDPEARPLVFDVGPADG